MTEQRRDRLCLFLLVPLVVAVSAWLTSSAGLELHFDEAQYWEWSRQLDWSYYSKGPLVAWLIALSEGLFGHGEWQTRLPAWIIHGLWLILLHQLAKTVWGTSSAGWWAVLIGLTTPLYFALGLVMTTDILLFFCWTAGLWMLFLALYRDRPAAWYGAGIAFGAGALTKLSIALLPISVLPFILIFHRQVLANRHLWGGVAVMLLVMTPMLYWNWQHDWLMFRHELHHVEGDGRANPVTFLLGQWLVLSPIVAAVAARLLWRRPRLPEQRFLWWTSLLVLAFFTSKAFGAKVQVNWPAPVYIGLIILFAGGIGTLRKAWRRTLLAGVAASLLLMYPIFFPASIGLAPGKDPLRVTKAWRQTVGLIHKAVPQPAFLMTHNYQIAAELAYYWPGTPTSVYIPSFGQRRFNQHDLWPGIEREKGRDGLYVSTSDTLPDAIAGAFAHCDGKARPVKVLTGDGQVIRTLFIRMCNDYLDRDTWTTPVGY